MGSPQRATTLAAAACFFSLILGHEADACMHGGEWLPDESVEEVLRAEQQVVQGDYEPAARNVVARFPRIRSRRLHRSVLGDRALRVMAQAVVRTSGEIDLGSYWPGASQAARNDNIEWSVNILQSLSLARPDDTVAQSAVAEAFALVPGRRADAKRILAELEQKDLLSSPQAFATLAALRDDAGRGRPAFLALPLRTLDHARARVARARCHIMATKPSLCTPSSQATAQL